MLTTLLISFVCVAGASSECISDPAEWLSYLKLAMSGGDFVCADPNLMIRFDAIKKTDDDPLALSKFNNFWAWASDSDTMDVYMRMAPDSGNDGAKFAEEIMTYVGFTDTSVSDDYKYKFTVFKKDGMSAASPFPPFQPVWQALFDYFYSFTVCAWHGGEDGEDLCDEAGPWSIQFNDAVKYNLTNMDVDDVTDCSADFSDCWNGNGCAKAFCDMDNDLYDARGDSSLHPNGVLAAANLYRNYVNHEGDPVPMDMMIDDQARAFFDIVLGATWLFTGGMSQLERLEVNVDKSTPEPAVTE